MELLPNEDALRWRIGDGNLACQSLCPALFHNFLFMCQTRAMLSDRFGCCGKRREGSAGTLGGRKS